MLGYIVRRLGQAAIVILGVTLLIFVLKQFVPADQVARSVLGSRATQQQVEQFNRQQGDLLVNIIVQFPRDSRSLLLLRMAIPALLALAMARPIWKGARSLLETLFAVVVDVISGAVLFGIFHGVATPKADVVEMINMRIAQIDELISAQLNEVLHQPDFQKLEATWRGMHYLVSNTETSSRLKLRVMNISKKELLRDLE